MSALSVIEGLVLVWFPPPLGRYDDYAVGAARSVDRRRGGVLEDRDRFDVGHVQVVEVADGVHHAVHHDQRLVRGRDRARTADADRSRGARFARGGHDVGAGDAALQRLVDGQHREVLYVGDFDVGHRTRGVALLHRAVADDDHFVHGHRLRRLERDVERGLPADRDGLLFIAEVLEFEDLAVADLQRIGARRRGGRAALRADDDHRGARHRRAVFVGHDARQLVHWQRTLVAAAARQDHLVVGNLHVDFGQAFADDGFDGTFLGVHGHDTLEVDVGIVVGEGIDALFLDAGE